MTEPEPEVSTLADLDPSGAVRRLPGRNRTKADVRIHSTPAGEVAVKDYGPRPWLVRQTLGRLLIRRASSAAPRPRRPRPRRRD